MTQSIDATPLKAIAENLSVTFSAAMSELQTIRSSAKDLTSELDTICDITSTDPGNGLDEAFAEHATSVAGIARKAAHSLDDPEFRHALRAASRMLREMQKAALELASVSSLGRISHGEEEITYERLMAFTGALTERCEELRRAASVSLEMVGQIQRSREISHDRLNVIDDQFRGLLQVREVEAAELETLASAHLRHLSEIRHGATALGGKMTEAVGELIGCLQFPDAFSQRVEHVVAALGAVPGAQPEERKALLLVSAAHLEMMAQSLTDITCRAENGLTGVLSTLNASSVIGGSTQEADPSEIWLREAKRVNRVRISSVKTANDRLEDVDGVITDLTSAIETTRSNLEKVVRCNRDLEISVHNAAVVAARSGNTHSTLRFLSKAVDSIVGRSLTLVVDLDNALTTLRQTADALKSNDLAKELEALSRVQDEAAQSEVEQRSLASSVDTSRQNLAHHASRLGRSAAAGKRAFAAAHSHSDALLVLAQRVRDAVSDPDVSPAGLDWLFKTYTMDEERRIHEAALGPVSVSDAGADDDEDHDLSDFLM